MSTCKLVPFSLPDFGSFGLTIVTPDFVTPAFNPTLCCKILNLDPFKLIPAIPIPLINPAAVALNMKLLRAARQTINTFLDGIQIQCARE